MNNYWSKLLYELIRYGKTSDDKTSMFKNLKHNNDLCPKIKNKIDEIFDCYLSYRKIIYDIQGFRDDGTDIVIRVCDEDVDTPYYICLQVKSEDDLNKKDYLQTIKAQAFESERRYGRYLIDYYIFLCCDSKLYKNKIRAISAEVTTLSAIHVIEPNYIANFLELNHAQTLGIVSQIEKQEDAVLKMAKDITDRLCPTQIGLLIFVIYLLEIDGSKNLTDEVLCIDGLLWLDFLYEIVPDYPYEWFFCSKDEEGLFTNRERPINDRLAEDIESLNNVFYDIDPSNGNVMFRRSQYLSVTIITIDAWIRYGYSVEQLIEHMLNLVGPIKGFSNIEYNGCNI